MALQKVDYVNGETVITAENMNDIQDAIIELENATGDELFWAIYGSTTGAEVEAAMTAGTPVFLNYYGMTYSLVDSITAAGGDTTYHFALPIVTFGTGYISYEITLTGSSWAGPTQRKIARTDSPSFTGTPKAPTAAAGTNTTQIATTAFVKTAIDNQLSAVYKAAGSVASISALPSPSASYLGYVYDVESAFTTTADFVEGAGVDYPAGTDVAIIAVQSGGTTTYKYDALSGFVDLSGYIEKPANAAADDFLCFNGTTWAAKTVPNANGVNF